MQCFNTVGRIAKVMGNGKMVVNDYTLYYAVVIKEYIFFHGGIIPTPRHSGLDPESTSSFVLLNFIGS